jgi:hypothetical protein
MVVDGGECRILWTSQSLAFAGNVRRIRAAIRAVQPFVVNARITNAGVAVMLLAAELIALDVRVTVHVADGHMLKHSCGRVYAPADWDARPASHQTVRSHATGKVVLMPQRECACGASALWDSLTIVHPDDLCTSRGGQA